MRFGRMMPAHGRGRERTGLDQEVVERGCSWGCASIFAGKRVKRLSERATELLGNRRRVHVFDHAGRRVTFGVRRVVRASCF